jgi:hypothetical protein
LGFKVSGKVAPETVKPIPATLAAAIVTGEVPVEESVSVCVVGVFTFTLPKPMLPALTPRVALPLPNSSAKICDTPLALAVRVTVCEVLTEETVAMKLAAVAPAATVTVAGTVTAESLLVRLTIKPPLPAAALRVTVQLSVPAPVIDPFVQLSELSVGKVVFSCTPKVSTTPLALAVKVTAWGVLTAEAVAVNLADVAPGATVTEAGTVKAELLLVRFTLKPAPVAAAFTVTVQLSVPTPVIDPLLQLIPLNTGTPLPLRVIKVEVPLVELLVTVIWPVSVPAAVGSNCTVSAAV